jgi:hypothetical protein
MHKLIALWRERSEFLRGKEFAGTAATAFNDCADELEAALAQPPASTLREQIEALPTIQHGSPTPNYFEATPLIRKSDVLALLSAAGQPQENDLYSALRFAAGAITDAIGLEDGLDGRAGEAVLGIIDAALVAHGQEPMERPQHDTDAEWFARYLRSRLADLNQGVAGQPAQETT